MEHILTVQTEQTAWRKVAVISFFVLLTALAARITVWYQPVPITLQTMAVVLSGLMLGARGGAAAQLTYLGLIAMGWPLDAYGLGSAVFFGPTVGYLIGFVPAAYVSGWLAERFSTKSRWGNLFAALAGMVVIYVSGASWLAYFIGWQAAWSKGVVLFILPDMLKAMAAVGVAGSRK